MTRIEWTDKVWNPTVGCSRVSPGCDGCYAIAEAHRGRSAAHRGLTVRNDHGTDWTGEVRCLPDRLTVPLRVRKPTRWFVDSMSDLFHPAVPDDFIAHVLGVVAVSPRHSYQVLTKRPQRAQQLLADDAFHAGVDITTSMWRYKGRRLGAEFVVPAWPLLNLWLGTSIESDRYTWRADHVRQTPAAVRWLSLEPLIGPLPSLDLDGIDWVVVGGESGPRARPPHPDWVRDIRDRCIDAGVAFLFKQWGAWAPLIPHLQAGGPPPARCVEIATPDGSRRGEMARVGKKTAGRELDGRTWHQFPDDPEGVASHG